MTTLSVPGTPLRVGVIGLGWAGEQHLRAYADNPAVEVIGIAGLEADRLDALSTELEIPVAEQEWQQLLARGDLDAVSVAVPTFLHAPISIAALDAGIHVLSEKPMARTASEADEMVAAAQRAGRVLEVAFNYRYRGDVSALRAEVDGGGLGTIYHARGQWLRRAGIPTLGSWFTNAEMSGGGPLIDLGVHVLDALLVLMGEPAVESVCAVTHSALGPRGLGGAANAQLKTGGGSAYEVEDLATALLRLEGGRSLTLETSWASHRPTGDDFQLLVYGTEGGADIHVLDYEPNDVVPVYAGPGTGEQDRALPTGEGIGHVGVVNDFVSTLLEPTSWSAHDGSVAAERARIIEACYRSAATGQQIDLTRLGPEVPR